MIPDGDILPTRAKYSLESNDYQVALNHLYATTRSEGRPLVRAARSRGLRAADGPSADDRGRLPIVPRRQLPVSGRSRCAGPSRSIRGAKISFARVIEERKRLANNPSAFREERKRLDKALKVLANATSYGIFAEMRRKRAHKEACR